MLCVTAPVIMVDLGSTNRIVLARFWVNSLLLQEGWVKQYGSTMIYKGFNVRWRSNIALAILNTTVLQSNGLFTTMDTRATNHVLLSPHSIHCRKPPQARYILSQVLGKGGLFHHTVFVCTDRPRIVDIPFVEGAHHLQQVGIHFLCSC